MARRGAAGSMTVKMTTGWSRRKFAYISLMLALAEILMMGIALFRIQRSHQPPTPQVLSIIDTTWLIGGLGSFGFAVAAIVADFDRKVAIFALWVSIVVSLICGIPLMVSA